MKTKIEIESGLLQYAMELTGHENAHCFIMEAIDFYCAEAVSKEPDCIGGTMPDVYDQNPEWDRRYNRAG